MVIGGDLGAPAWLSTIGTGLKSIGTTAAQSAAAGAAQQAGVMLNRAAGQMAPQAPPPPPKAGIPKGLIIALSVAGAVGLIALVAGRKSSPRPQVANPRRRRRRRRRNGSGRRRRSYRRRR
jgi:hypothetical protein